MNARFNELEASLSGVQTALTANATRITDLEEASTDYERRISCLEQLCSSLSQENTSLKSKVTDLEARSRQQNIKIAGLPENIEKGNPTQFVSGLLPSLLGEVNFPTGVKVDRAHRIVSSVNNRPQVMIARIHHDTVMILFIMRLNYYGLLVTRLHSLLRGIALVSSRTSQQRCLPNTSCLMVLGRS